MAEQALHLNEDRRLNDVVEYIVPSRFSLLFSVFDGIAQVSVGKFPFHSSLQFLSLHTPHQSFVLLLLSSCCASDEAVKFFLFPSLLCSAQCYGFSSREKSYRSHFSSNEKESKLFTNRRQVLAIDKWTWETIMRSRTISIELQSL